MKHTYFHIILYFCFLSTTSALPQKQEPLFYTPDIWKDTSYDTFDLLLLDGGAYAYLNTVFQHVSGRAMLKSYMQGTLLKDFEVNQKIKWDKYFHINSHPKIRKQLEKHVWLNRLYLLLPMAHEFYKSKDEYWAKEFISLLKSWHTDNPYLYHNEFKYERGNYIWYDMQVCWRFLVLAHSIPLLQDSKSFTNQDREALLHMLKLHGEHIRKEVLAGFEKNKARGNHFLQKGLVLLIAANEYSGLFDQETYLNLAMKVIKHINERETLKDGSNIEGSPSYSHFIARMYIDCYLSLKNHKLKIPTFLMQTIEHQYTYLKQSTAPNGLTLPFGDSYHLNAKDDIKFVEKVSGLKFKSSSKESLLFSGSNSSCLKNGKITVYLNGFTPGAYSHLQGGAPNLIAYYDKEPILWEAGMCNYDDDFIDYHRSFDGHSSMSIQPLEGKKITWRDFRKSPPKIDLLEFNPESSSVKYRFSFNKKHQKIHWIREVTLQHNTILVLDQLSTNFDADFIQNFHCYKGNSFVDHKKNAIYIAQESTQLKFTHSHKDNFLLSKNPSRDVNNTVFFAPNIQRKTTGKTAYFQTKIEISQLLNDF